MKINLKKNLIYSTLYQMLLVVTPFITTPYLSRALGLNAIGINSFVQSMMTYFKLFASLGISTYGLREIARHRDSKAEYSGLFWEIQLLSFLATAVSLLGWLVFILMSRQYRMLYAVLIPYLMGSAFDVSWFLDGLEQFRLTVTRSMFFKVLEVVLTLVLVKSPDDLWVFLVILSSCYLLSGVSMWTALPRFLGKVSFRSLNIFRHLRPTLIYFLPTVATSVYTVLDITLIQYITGNNSQNGYYAQAEKILKIAKSLSFDAVTSVFGARISYLFVGEKTDEINEKIEYALNLILFLSIGFAFGISGVAKVFVPFFYGPGYDPVIKLLYIFCPILLVVGVSESLVWLYYLPSGRRGDSTKYIIIGAFVNLCLNLKMIPSFGAFGAAFASVLAETLIAWLHVRNSDGYVSVPQLAQICCKKLIAGAVMLAAVVFLGRLPFGAFAVLIIQVPVGGLIYCAMLLLLRDKWATDACGQLIGFARKKLKRS